MTQTRWRYDFILVLLIIEFIDELLYGTREAALPLLRADLQLSYTQIGLLLSVPGLIGNLIEPFFSILADTWKRKVLILGGGCIFVLSSLVAAASQSFLPLLVAYIFSYPASGAYVGLSQAVLMDLQPARHEQNMARWTFAGSLGVVIGPFLVGGAALLGWSWRIPFWIVGLLTMIVFYLSWQAYRGYSDPVPMAENGEKTGFLLGIRNAGRALSRKEVRRWLILLQFSDLMLDTLYSFLALYLVDVAGLTPASAGLAVGIWTGVGLLGDLLLIPLVERIPGLVYLRISALLELALFPALLLAPWLPVKLIILGLLGFFNSGWYSILAGQLYSAMPGQSGTVNALDTVVGWFWKLIPLSIGLIAQRFGLGTAMWVLWLGPIALSVGLPRTLWSKPRLDLKK